MVRFAFYGIAKRVIIGCVDVSWSLHLRFLIKPSGWVYASVVMKRFLGPNKFYTHVFAVTYQRSMPIPTASASSQVPETVGHLSLDCCRFSNAQVPLTLEKVLSFGVLSAKSYVPGLEVFDLINSNPIASSKPMLSGWVWGAYHVTTGHTDPI